MKPALIVEQPDGYDVAIGVQKPSVIQKCGSRDERALIDAKSGAFEKVDLSSATAQLSSTSSIKY